MTTDEQSAYAIAAWQRFDKEITDEVARAVVSAFALVAVVDGDLAESEIGSFITMIHDHQDTLAALKFEHYEHLFRDICAAIMSNPEAGKSKALESISAISGNPEHSELILAAAQIAMLADQREKAAETEALALIRGALNR
jgi:tellurite resistance protein